VDFKKNLQKNSNKSLKITSELHKNLKVLKDEMGVNRLSTE
jgi:hypothetical protein